MTESDLQLLNNFEAGKLRFDEVLEKFSVDLKTDISFIKNEINQAIHSADLGSIQTIIQLLWFSGNISNFTNELNELLVNPNHISHQRIAKALQDIKSPTSIPYVRRVLESKFSYLEYTCSDSGAIAKWFSWLLESIGTKEAIALIEEYSNAEDIEIGEEMNYRWSKLNFKKESR